MTAPALVLRCPDCGSPMVQRKGQHGLFWGCIKFGETGCKGTHGAHPDGRPLGRPASRATKDARIKAHDAFDLLWKKGFMRRGEAYDWLGLILGRVPQEAHIANLDLAECQRVERAAVAELEMRREAHITKRKPGKR